MMMVPVRFAVGRNMHQLRPIPSIRKSPHQSLGKCLATRQQPPKGDLLRDRPIVKEEANGSARWKAAEIRCFGIDLATFHTLPLLVLVYLTKALCLRWGKTRKFYHLLCKNLKGLCIDSCLRKPHAFRVPPKSFLEIFYSPDDLRPLIS